MTLCVISQPRFFPGLHYLHRMMVADIFVVLDNVQFNPRHEENRAKLKTPAGPHWLTVPVKQSGRGQLISDTHVDLTPPWRRKAIAMLEHLYGKSPFYRTYADEIIDILEAPFQGLTQLDCASWEPALRHLGITCRIIRSSEIPVSGNGPRLLLDICRHLGADIYLSGAFGQSYLDVARFSAEGVGVRFHEYTYPVYQQRFGEFVPFLSYLDMLFNAGLRREQVWSGGTMRLAS